MKGKALVCLILISLFSLLVTEAVLAKDPVNLITGMKVVGNESIPEEEILSVVQSKVGDQIDNKLLQQDLQAVFDLGYFFDVRINFEPYLGGAKLIFQVVENPVLTEVRIKGAEIIDPERLKELMLAQPGQMLNTKALDEDLRQIEQFYKDEGLVLAYVSDVNLTDDDALEISINEGFLNDIIVTGNEKTRDYIIRRELSIEPGEVFDLNKVVEDRRDIYNLGLFNNITPRIEPIEEGSNKVNLVWEVEEKKTGQLQTGAGYSNKDGWFGYVEVSEQNLFGRAQRVGFKWEFGQTTNYQLSFYDPWLFGEQFSFGVDIYNTTTKNDKDVERDSEYSKTSRGASIKIGKPLAENITGSLKFKYDNTLTDWEDSTIEDEQGDTRSLTLATVRDTTDNPFNPMSGGAEVASVEYAGQLLGGDYDFTKFNFEVRRYFPGFKEEHSWAFRTQAGFATGELPFQEEFKLGGGETLRGFERGAFSGDRMVLANLEYRFPIVKSLQGAVFTDLGNAWERDMDMSFKDLNLSLGAGVRMNTPLGQIRLDYAFSKEGGKPHFSIGQTF